MKLTICLEQTLGHRAHTRNLAEALTSVPQLEWIHIVCPERRRIVPWTIRGSIAAFRSMRRGPRADVALYHTQAISLLAPITMRGRRYVISIDATPAQMDEMGKWYAHARGNRLVEAVKAQCYRHVFRRAARVIAWSTWVAESLVKDYGVDPAKIAVIAPGAPPPFFAIERPSPPPRRRPTVLFVGGDFPRKGGPALLDAFAKLGDRADLILVTPTRLDLPPGVRQIANATPGSHELLDAYAAADIFCLPTLADCTSVAVQEAMAAGLAVVTTSVGSNPETVVDGTTGILIPPGDDEALFAALDRLVSNPTELAAIGAAARLAAFRTMQSAENARRLVALLESVA